MYQNFCESKVWTNTSWSEFYDKAPVPCNRPAPINRRTSSTQRLVRLFIAPLFHFPKTSHPQKPPLGALFEDGGPKTAPKTSNRPQKWRFSALFEDGWIFLLG